MYYSRFLVLGFVALFLLVNGTYAIGGDAKISRAAPPPGMKGESVLNQLPDISAIGMVSGYWIDKTDKLKNKLTVQSFELAFQGYVYPNIYMNFFPALHSHEGTLEAELCEGYVDFQNLWGGFAVQAGKFHVDVGKINKEHSHKRFEFNQASVFTNFFGHHGMVGDGLTLRYLFPWEPFTELKLGGYSISGEPHSDEGSFGLAHWAFMAKLKSSVALADTHELEVGFSAVQAEGAHYTTNKVEYKGAVTIAGVDLTYRTWLSGYQRITFRNELFHLIRTVSDDKLRRWGFYNQLEYRWDKYFTSAIRYDWADSAMPDGKRTQSLSPIIGYNFNESTRLLGQYTYFFKEPDNAHRVAVQLVVGLGPHSHTME